MCQLSGLPGAENTRAGLGKPLTRLGVHPMSKVTHLASGALTRAGDQLSIELHQPLDSPSFVMVVWPVALL
jgi:hypothetical protein